MKKHTIRPTEEKISMAIWLNSNGVSRTYDAANRLVHDGTTSLTYDPNGNLTSDGTNGYTWDRANRLLAHGGISYKYNGDGVRIQQDALKYILDLQPGLSVVLGDSDGNRFVHGPRGLHAVSDGVDWTYPVTDGLGSVRGYLDIHGTVLSSVHYGEWGVPSAGIVGPAFTGEPRDVNGLQYHRARYYAPGLAVWTALDPWEGLYSRPMSLNGYSWVEGDPINRTDPSGMCAQPTEWWNPIDVNCYYSAVGLAQRFSGGDSGSYDAWFNVLIQKDWHELKLIEATGSLADVSGAARHFLNTAAIIPGLYNENPLALLEALRIAECQYSGSIEGPLARLIYPLFETMYLTTTASGVMWGQSITAPRPWGLDTPLGQGSAGSGTQGGWRPGTGIIVVGTLIIGGALVAVGGLMLWDELTSPGSSALNPAIPQAPPIFPPQILPQPEVLGLPRTYYFSDVDEKSVPISRRWGDCDETTYGPLRAAKKATCDRPGGRTCRGSWTCAELAQRLLWNLQCIKAREAIRDICYRGQDNAEHVMAITEAINALRICLTKLRQSCPDILIPDEIMLYI